MAKQVKIVLLDKGLGEDLPKIIPLVNEDLLSVLEGSESKVLKALYAALDGFSGAELTDEDRKALAQINEDLVESAGKWDRKRADLIVANSTTIAKLAQKHAEDPVELTKQITKAEAKRAKDLVKITEDQAEAEAELTTQKAGIENKQAEAGIEAFRKILNYTEGSSGDGSRYKLKDHSWLVLDLLKKADEKDGRQYDHYGIWFLHGPTRQQWFYGIGAGIGIGKSGIQIEREQWKFAGNKIDHKDANSPTGAQRYYHYCLSHAHMVESLEDLTLKANNVAYKGNLPGYNNGNCGGVASMYRIVEKADPESKAKTKTWKDLAEQYKFPVAVLPEYQTEDPEAEAEAEEKPKAKKAEAEAEEKAA